MEFETPEQLHARLKLGREEFRQRLLTSLILNAPYPRWNTRSTPSTRGREFLRKLHELSYADGWQDEDCFFVDEFELPARSEWEMGGAPDYAVLWDDALWLIELKTERASHRRPQLKGYFDLARFHYPAATIDLTYVTPPMDAPAPPLESGCRYAHVSWTDVARLIASTWPNAESQSQQAVIDGVLDLIARLDETPTVWRSGVAMAPQPEEEAEAPNAAAEPVPELSEALQLAQKTATDGRQRAIEYRAPDLDTLLALRIEIRERLVASPTDSPLRHVRPWLWGPTTDGQPLTDGGRESGYELRLSRYAQPLA